MGIYLPRLIVGSEGTLAIVIEITLRTVPVPPAHATVLLPFARLSDAADAAAVCRDASPVSCDLYDWRSIHLVREVSPSFREWIPDSAESILVLLFEGDDPEEVSGRARLLAERVSRKGRVVADPVVTTRRAECEKMVGFRRAVEPLLMRMTGKARPASFIDDVAVPPEMLGEMIHRLQDVMKSFGLTWTLDAHAGHGQIHLRPFLDLDDPSEVAKLEPVATAVYDASLALGGTISGEGGCGMARSQFVRKQYGDLFPVFRELKEAFDPMGLLNPGKVLGDDPHQMTQNLRGSSVTALALVPEGSGSVILPVLRWGVGGPIATAGNCNGCGVCRSGDLAMRMCPTFRALKAEAATPRAKANLLRQIASGAVEPRYWGSEELKQNADLCVHCKLCTSECPSGIDVSSLMLEAKAYYVANHGLSPGDWALSRIELWSRLASRLPILSNAILSSRIGRWMLERITGLSRLRRLPRPHRTPFTARAARLGLTKPRPQEPGPRVVYFVDVFANYFDQELAEAVVAVLRHAGVNVFVPPAQRGSGMPALVLGDVDHARSLAQANLRVLGDAVRDGYAIVCSEPTAALMLRSEYLKLTEDLDAQLVASNTHDVGEYIVGLDARNQLPAPSRPAPRSRSAITSLAICGPWALARRVLI